MKNFFQSVIFVVVLFVSPVFAAEYIVQEGETLASIAKKLHVPVDHLSSLNHILPPRYVVKFDQKLRYVSAQDKERALQWARMYAECFPQETQHPEYVYAKRMIDAIEKNLFFYGQGKSEHVHAADILAVAQAMKK